LIGTKLARKYLLFDAFMDKDTLDYRYFGFYCILLKGHKLERVLSTSIVVNKITYIGFWGILVVFIYKYI